MGNKGVVASAAALSVLLQEGIGDTIRVSLTPAPNGARTVTSPTANTCPLCPLGGAAAQGPRSRPERTKGSSPSSPAGLRCRGRRPGRIEGTRGRSPPHRSAGTSVGVGPSTGSGRDPGHVPTIPTSGAPPPSDSRVAAGCTAWLPRSGRGRSRPRDRLLPLADRRSFAAGLIHPGRQFPWSAGRGYQIFWPGCINWPGFRSVVQGLP